MGGAIAPAWQEWVRRASTAPGVINLGGGLPSARQFPRAALAAAALRVVKAPQSSGLQYGWAEGQARLRGQIAARLTARGAPVAAEDILVTSGAQQAIAIATQLLLRRGEGVGVADETYPAALDLFRLRKVVPRPLTDSKSAKNAKRARCNYVMTVSNPLGTCLADAAREALLASRGPIIEDDAYGELLFKGPSVPLLLGQARRRTFHVGTFSKTLCPGLRVGWLVVPPADRARARRLKEGDDLQANSLAQAIVSDYLGRVDFDERLHSLRRFYARRAARLAGAIDRALPSWRFRFPDGGFCLWINADAAVDERRFMALALEEGVTCDPGSSFRFRRRAAGPTQLRVCFSFVPPGQFEEAVRRLARAWRRAARSGRGVGQN